MALTQTNGDVKMSVLQRQSAVLCILLVTIQGFSLWGIVTRGNHDFIGNIVGSTFFWLAYTLFEYIYKIKINYFIRFTIVIAIISDGFLGFYLNLYVTSFLFDRIQHVFSACVFSLFFYSILMNFKSESIGDRWIRFVFLTAIGMAVGSINEIIEFATDIFIKPQILNQPSLQDTDMDLVSNTIGAVIAGIYSLYYPLGNGRGEKTTKRFK